LIPRLGRRWRRRGATTYDLLRVDSDPLGWLPWDAMTLRYGAFWLDPLRGAVPLVRHLPGGRVARDAHTRALR
jgi:hypothetical protein